jgi:aryl-alcohol dehydrogenase-like predicted oxidoreductase
VDVVLSGATTVEQLTDNLVAVGLDLGTGEVAAALGTPEDPTTYWRRRDALRWT